MKRQYVNDELERMWKGTIPEFACGNEENHEKPQSG
jgi:hypothetical protein